VESSLPEPVRAAVDTWLGHHDQVAPGLVEGLYLVGSVALGDWRPRSDLDIVAFTADPASDDDAELLRAAHEAACADLGISVDGPRLAWGDVSGPPLPLHRPWTLDGAFRHDGECFEINPITWYTLAEYGVAVRGEPASLLGVATDLDGRRQFVRGNVATYWRSVGEQLAAALADPTRTEFDVVVVEWCGLGAARMLFTLRTGDVASKTAAGEWAAAELPDHADVLRTAIGIRHTIEPPPVDRRTVEQVHALVAETVRVIAG
jgi:hypothetical protein